MWSAVGTLAALAPSPRIALLVAFVYVAIYGPLEALMLPLRAPGMQWQVPATWVTGRPQLRQELTWSLILGPGFVTRNPYAGFWLALILLPAFVEPLTCAAVGAAIGGAHGLTRAVGILRNMRCSSSTSHLAVMSQGIRWRYLDGLYLVLVLGLLLPSV